MEKETAEELLKQLRADQNKYLESLNQTTELLTKLIASSAHLRTPTEQPLPRQLPYQLTADTLRQNDHQRFPESTIRTQSVATGDETSSSDGGDSLYVDKPLRPEQFDIAGLREHIRRYPWNEAGQKILENIVRDEAVLSRPDLFPTDLETSDDRSHLSHSSIYEVRENGLPVANLSDKEAVSRSLDIWKRIRSINMDKADPDSDEDKAVGKIVIIREPSPLLFAAAHYVMNEHFDMDEVFDFLVHHDPMIARPHKPFEPDHRRRRTFLFNMEYFTLVGEGCEPMPWQRFDNDLSSSETHIPLSRCSAVIALSLEGEPVSTIRSRNRRTNKKSSGKVYDPFSPWRVIQLQAYPDWESTVLDLEDDSRQRRHLVNGPEAFLTLLLQEFRDASKRLTRVYRRVEDLVQVPPDFIFNEGTRDRLLFEDDEFTYSRRYFWAAQTLAIMVQDIRDMVEGFREAFTDAVWQGSDKTIWPGEDVTSARHANWRKRMALLRGDLEREIQNLELLERINEKKIRFICDLRDNLFSGTSVMESRKSIQMAHMSILQNNNVRILTLVTIFFLPLTFVTSIYGMTNMDPDESFAHFGYTTAAICMPCYLLIFTLNTESGLAWWMKRFNWCLQITSRSTRWLFALFNYNPEWLQPKKQDAPVRNPWAQRPSLKRSMTGPNDLLSLNLSKTFPPEPKSPEPRPPLLSPGSGSVRFEFQQPRPARTQAPADNDAGLDSPVKTGSLGSDNGVGSLRQSGRSRTFVDLFRKKKMDDEKADASTV